LIITIDEKWLEGLVVQPKFMARTGCSNIAFGFKYLLLLAQTVKIFKPLGHLKVLEDFVFSASELWRSLASILY
jgi:hypothetical protein